ncbi:hypothetical protein S83_037246, partial [Arachis hypogaea]
KRRDRTEEKEEKKKKKKSNFPPNHSISFPKLSIFHVISSFFSFNSASSPSISLSLLFVLSLPLRINQILFILREFSVI